MNPRTAVAVVLLLATSGAVAQLTIDNPKHLNLPEGQAHVLLRMSCQAVAKELRIKDQRRLGLDVRLVLGEKDERFGLDEKTDTPTIFLQEWSAEKFALAVVRFAIARSIDPHRERQIITAILSRSQRILPVPTAQLHEFVGGHEVESPAATPDCLGRISDASARTIWCHDVRDNNRGSMTK